jgi:hypothetical protein
VQALIRDIDAFLSSQPVSVMPLHSLPNRCGALIRRHVLTLCAIAIAAGSLWLWAGERMSQFASWGKPELVINATTSHPASLVRITSGAFKEVPGGIVSAGAEENIAFFPQRLDGPIAIEYEAFMQVDQPPCDVSVIYATRDPFLADTTPARYMIQVGALDNTCAQILDPELRRVAYKPLHLIPGQRHRVRVEIDEESILIMVDGEDVCEHRTIVPFTGGWVGLYGFYPGKMFANIALFKKGIPARIASMTIGDQFCRDGQWERAAGFYEQLAKDHAGTSIADEAAYRCGIAWTRAGDLESAQRMWKKVGHGHWRGRTQVHEIEEMLEGRIPVPGSPPLQLNRDASLPSRNQTLAEAVVHRITAAYPDANRDLRSRLEATWNSAVLRMGGPDLADKRAITALLEARNSLFPERCNHMAAAAQHAMRDFAGVALRHPEHAAIAADALFRLGKHEEVLERYRDFRFQVGTALMAMGRFDELRSMQPPMPYLVSLADTTYGFDAASFDPVAAQAAIKAGSEGPMTLLRFAQLLDLPDEAMALCRNNVYPPSDTVLTVHLQAGQEDLLLRTYPNWLGARIAATCHQQLRYFTAGQPVKRLDLPQDEGWFSDRLDWIPRLLVKPFVDHISGDPQAMQQALDAIANQHRWHFAQQPWFCGELLSGRIDADAFARQPCHVGVTTLADLCLGMKAELDGSRQTAREAYTRLLSRPPHLRTIHGPNRDPTAEQFARWRLKALEAIR